MEALYGFLITVASVAMYWLPTIVAARRKVPHVGSVAVIDGLLGWTVIGWVIAMAMACRNR